MPKDIRVIDVLLTLAPTVRWLSDVEPINAADVPAEHIASVKQLENMGLVYRRNCRNCSLQRQRLVRMLKRESRYAGAEKQEQCLSAFAMILEVQYSSQSRRNGGPQPKA